MRKEKIIWNKCEITGEWGYTLSKNLNKNWGEIRASEGLLIAHDIIEHQRGVKNIGTTFDEIMALGGWWFTRVETGYSSNSNEENLIRSEFTNLIHYPSQTLMRARLDKSKRIHKDYLSDHVIEYIKKIPFDYCLREDEDLTEEKFETYKEYFIYHFKLGYRMAYNRFKGDNYLALDLFKNIRDKVNEAHADEIFEATLSYDLKGNVKLISKGY